MARRKYASDAVNTTLVGSITAAATSLVVADATGYPVVPFFIVIDPDLPTEERVLVGAKSGTTFSSLTRASDGSAASAHTDGSVVKHVVTATDFEDAAAHRWDDPAPAGDTDTATGVHHTLGTAATQAAPGDVVDDHVTGTAEHGATGAVVGTTNAQTLSNKTLVTPTIADLSNAEHDHRDAQGGGLITASAEPMTTAARDALAGGDLFDGRLVQLTDGAKVLSGYSEADARWKNLPDTDFGDGSDGAVTISGSTTLVRDMKYETLVVQNGGTLITDGYTVRARTSITIDAGGVIHADGANGGNPTGTPNGGGGGGAGGGVVVLITPTLTNNGTIRANGGNGGNGTNGGGAGTAGAGGSTTRGGGGGGGGSVQSGQTPGAAGSGIFAAAAGTANSGAVGGGNGASTGGESTQSTRGAPSAGRFVGGQGGDGGQSTSTAGLGGLSSPHASPRLVRVGVAALGYLQLFGGAGGGGGGKSDAPSGAGGGGGGGGLIVTITRTRSGSGTYDVSGGSGGTGAGGSNGNLGSAGLTTHLAAA